ncbi:MAG: preprotein translocase subunit YajC [Phycisphaerales bacterium]|nr:preprotein translocase subunit YajC [Phycisphaerales bacterium]
MLELLAQTTAPGAPAQPQPLVGIIVQYLPLVAVVLLMYFFVFNAKRKDEAKRKAMIDEIKRGDRVQTIGGILGTVVQADADEITVKVDESTNTKIKFTRSAVHKVLGDKNATDAK